LALLDVLVQGCVTTDGVDEIPEVDDVPRRTLARGRLRALRIEDPVTVSLLHEAAVLAVERDEGQAFVAARIAGAVIEGGAAIAEVEGGDPGVGGFLVVVVMVAAAEVGDAAGQVRVQTPPG